jgi:CheY-like chemotaxis protein
MDTMGPSPPERNRRLVLVVDDNCDYADSLCELLSLESDLEVRSAYSVHAALENVAVRRPDAILLDLELPPLSGFDAADALEQAFPDDLPVLIAVSGNSTLLRIASRDARFSQVILKPADPVRLIDCLDRFLH